MYSFKTSSILTFPFALKKLRFLLYSKLSASITIPSLVLIIPLSSPLITFPFSKTSIVVTLKLKSSKLFAF